MNTYFQLSYISLYFASNRSSNTILYIPVFWLHAYSNWYKEQFLQQIISLRLHGKGPAANILQALLSLLANQSFP